LPMPPLSDVVTSMPAQVRGYLRSCRSPASTDHGYPSLERLRRHDVVVPVLKEVALIGDRVVDEDVVNIGRDNPSRRKTFAYVRASSMLFTFAPNSA
jgi:hypothetical protein